MACSRAAYPLVRPVAPSSPSVDHASLAWLIMFQSENCPTAADCIAFLVRSRLGDAARLSPLTYAGHRDPNEQDREYDARQAPAQVKMSRARADGAPCWCCAVECVALFTPLTNRNWFDRRRYAPASVMRSASLRRLWDGAAAPARQRWRPLPAPRVQHDFPPASSPSHLPCSTSPSPAWE